MESLLDRYMGGMLFAGTVLGIGFMCFLAFVLHRMLEDDRGDLIRDVIIALANLGAGVGIGIGIGLLL